MTEEEKAECRRRAADGFAQPADILLLGASAEAQRQLLRVLGVRPARKANGCRWGNWRICFGPENGRQKDLLTGFLKSCGDTDRKKRVILLASAGRGGRLRARCAWRRALSGAEEKVRDLTVLAVRLEYRHQPQARLFRRQEKDEWLLQQAAEECLGKQISVFTVPAGRKNSDCGEQLRYQLAKTMLE